MPWVEKYAKQDDRVRLVLNNYGPGPAQAIRSGFAPADGRRGGGHHGGRL